MKILKVEAFDAHAPLPQLTVFAPSSQGAVLIRVMGRDSKPYLEMRIAWREDGQILYKDYRMDEVSEAMINVIELVADLLLLRTSYPNQILITDPQRQVVVTDGLLSGALSLPHLGSASGQFIELMFQLAFCASGPKLSIPSTDTDISKLQKKFGDLLIRVRALPHTLALTSPFSQEYGLSKEESFDLAKYVEPWMMMLEH